MSKFRGTYQELQDRVALTGVHGEWVDRGNHKQFYAETGAVLNFWESTKTLSFQGDNSAANEIRAALDKVIAGNARDLR